MKEKMTAALKEKMEKAIDKRKEDDEKDKKNKKGVKKEKPLAKKDMKSLLAGKKDKGKEPLEDEVDIMNATMTS